MPKITPKNTGLIPLMEPRRQGTPRAAAHRTGVWPA